jgi:hypothetical protein
MLTVEPEIALELAAVEATWSADGNVYGFEYVLYSCAPGTAGKNAGPSYRVIVY